jgi:WD40 repeat protein
MVTTLAFDAQGRWLATSSIDRYSGAPHICLWDPQSDEAGPRVLNGHFGAVTTLAFDPQGRWLAAAERSRPRVLLWDLQRPTQMPRVIRQPAAVETLAFDPLGQWLATGSYFADTHRLLNLQTLETKPSALAFCRQGRWLATGMAGGTVNLWDLNSVESEPVVFRGHKSAVTSLAFDREGRWLASGSDDGTARLWNVVSPELGPLVLRGHEETVTAVAFDLFDRWLATGGRHGTVRLWSLDLRGLLEIACRRAGRNLSLAEWQQHAGDQPYQVTCERFPSGG